MSSRSLGLLAGFLVSQGRSSPASWRLMSSGSSVRKRMRPCSFTWLGSFSTLRSLIEVVTREILNDSEAGGQWLLRSLFRNLRWWQAFDSSGFDGGEFFEKLVVNKTIRSQDLAAGQLEGATVHVGDDAACFLDQQDAGSGVPWVERELPKPVHATRRNTAEI